MQNLFNTVLGPLIHLLQWLLNWFHSLAPNWSQMWGVSIILLTITVRLVLFPLTWKQFKSAQSMQAIQPKIKELQKKYKGDRAKVQEETMKLYQQYHVNPFASCLPVLLQLPVFISLYYAIKDTHAIDTASFLWIPALGKPDPYYILLILYVVTQVISTELMLVTQSDPTQKWIMRAMPIMFVFILFRFPAGLFVYWVTTNVWTIGQQLIIRRTMKPLELSEVAGKPKKRSRFMEAVMSAQATRGEQAKLTDGKGSSGAKSGKTTGSGAKSGSTAARKSTGAKSTSSGAKSGTSSKSGSRPAGQSGSRPSSAKPTAKRTSSRPPGKPKGPAKTQPSSPGGGPSQGGSNNGG